MNAENTNRSDVAVRNREEREEEGERIPRYQYQIGEGARILRYLSQRRQGEEDNNALLWEGHVNDRSISVERVQLLGGLLRKSNNEKKKIRMGLRKEWLEKDKKMVGDEDAEGKDKCNEESRCKGEGQNSTEV